MNNFKIASKLRIFAIISFVIIVLGMALGTVMHFVSDGFFNYGGEYDSYKSVTVSYVYTEFGKAEDVEAICENEFGKAGIGSYQKVSSNSGVNNEITYKFSVSADENKLQDAVSAINAGIAEATKEFNDVPQTRAAYHFEKTVLGGEKALSMAAIALAAIIAVHAVYSLIRYGVSGLCTAFAIQLHNLGLFAAVLALCRAPVTSSVMTFAVFVSLATAFCVTLLLEAVKRGRKENEEAKLSLAEITDLSASKVFGTNCAFCAMLAIASILVFVFSAISSLSLWVVLSPAVCALVAFIVSFYGSVLVAPSVYTAFCGMFGKHTVKPSLNKGK